MAGSPKLVPIKIAEFGTFKGHPSGPFELTAKTFHEIVDNFKRSGLLVPIDAEHASEQPSTEGSIPVEGAPAMGWIHKLEARNDGLWGMVEWLEPAKSYIQQGRYKYLSPAIRLQSRDTVTGEPVGAKLTSAAITNRPFLRGLGVLAAKDAQGNSGTDTYHQLVRMTDEEAKVLRATGAQLELRSSGLAHSPSEYMPAIKRALKLPELCSAKECADHLERLRAHHEADAEGDDDGVNDGVALDDYRLPLRALSGASPGATWDDVFDAVENMIAAAIGQHVVRDHDPEPTLNDPGPSAAEPITADDEAAGPDEEELTMSAEKIAALETEKSTLMSAKTALEGDKKTLTEQLALVNSEKAAALSDKGVALKEVEGLKVDKTKLELKVEELAGSLKAISEEIKTLKDEKAARVEKDLQLRVEKAFADHKSKKSLTEASKKGMMLILRADPAAFEADYPLIEPEHVHLNHPKTIGKREPAAPAMPGTPGAAPSISLRDAAHAYARQHGCTLGEAMAKLDEIARRNRTAAAR